MKKRLKNVKKNDKATINTYLVVIKEYNPS